MKTILIVDHVASQRELLVTWLKDDYTVCTAADGATGMALAEQTEPDLIFMALALPGGDGGEVARQIKAQARLRDIPLIALTSQAMPGGDAQARAAGWADALRTPLDEEQVSAILRKWLGGGCADDEWLLYSGRVCARERAGACLRGWSHAPDTS